MSVVGARPQFVKLSPVALAARSAGIQHVVVHTGQHYDYGMSESFFEELEIPRPDVNLHVGSGPHGVQTGGMIAALEPVIDEHRPDWVLAYGDTNSTLAAAVVATKLQVPLAHLEAGLRSFNRSMPEEHNRVMTDHASDLCLAPTRIALDHLEREGLAERSVVVGDVMVDVLRRISKRVKAEPVPSPIPPEAGGFTLATIHRPANTDEPARLAAILNALGNLPDRVYLAAHPRLVASAESTGTDLSRGSVQIIPPLAYPQLVQALQGAAHVVTDSGGLQKEAYVMGVPVTTVRSETEWVETLEGGWNLLCNDPQLLAEVALRPASTVERSTPFGDGNAAVRALQELTDRRIA